MAARKCETNGGSTALNRAVRIGRQAAEPGFDWPDTAGVHAKVIEELNEVIEAEKSGSAAMMKDEIGDLLFAVVSLARHLAVDPEAALNHANHKFEQRFGLLGDILREEGREMDAVSIDELEAAWQSAKRRLAERG